MRIGLIAILSLPFGAAARPASDRACAGYTFNHIVDEGRSFRAADGSIGPRPIDFGVWVPTGCGGRPVTSRDLLQDSVIQSGAAMPSLDTPSPTLEDEIGVAAPDARLAGLLSRPTQSLHMRAKAGPRGLPLVLYIHPSVLQAAPIAEKLAAAGFAVAAIKWRGSYAQDFDVGISGLTSEMLDAQAVLRTLANRGTVDPKRIFVIGMSFGALTALCLAQADPRVVALVSHDGGITTPTGTRLSPRCPYYTATRPSLKMLSLFDASYSGTTYEVTSKLPGVSLQAVPVPLLAHRDYVGTVLLRAQLAENIADASTRVRMFDVLGDATVSFLSCVRDAHGDDCHVQPIR